MQFSRSPRSRRNRAIIAGFAASIADASGAAWRWVFVPTPGSRLSLDPQAVAFEEAFGTLSDGRNGLEEYPTAALDQVDPAVQRNRAVLGGGK